jgi:hypothetical protein
MIGLSVSNRRACHRWLTIVAIAVAVAVGGGAALASEIGVIESYAGARPKDAALILAPLVKELEGRGHVGPRQIGPRVVERVSRPGSLGPEAVQRAIRLAEQGRRHWIEAEFDQAIAVLEEAVSLFHSSPAAFAADTARREVLLGALMYTSMAKRRLGRGDDAAATMAEVIRSFADTPFDRVQFGPEGFELYRAVKREVEAARTGRLRVEVDDEDAAIFINERFAGAGNVFDAAVPPGRYRVYTHKGATPGRLHLVDVAPGGSATVTIDWALDAALTAGAALVFADERSRALLESDKAVAIAQRIGLAGVIVVGIREYQGRRAIVGSLLSLDTGRTQRTAAVALEPSLPSEETVRGLARFLASGESAPGLLLPLDEPSHDRRRSYGLWKWGALASGAAAVATGVVLIQMDGPIRDADGNQTPEQRDTRTAGIVSTSAGAALLITGVTLWVLESRSGGKERPRAALVPLPSGGVAFTMGGQF